LKNKNRIAIDPKKFSIAMGIRKPEFDYTMNSTIRSLGKIPVAWSAGTLMGIGGRVFSRPGHPLMELLPRPPPPHRLRTRVQITLSPILAGHSSPLTVARVDKRPVFTKRLISGIPAPMISVKISFQKRFRPRPERKKECRTIRFLHILSGRYTGRFFLKEMAYFVKIPK